MQARRVPALVRAGFFGSYARGDWGVGSDLDLLALVIGVQEPFERRALDWPVEELPVPAQLLIYTQAEWQDIQRRGGRFAATLATETVWIFPQPPAERDERSGIERT